MTWKDVHVGFEGDGLKIGGMKVWDAEWRQVVEEPIQLPHPAYMSQIHSYWIYDMGIEPNVVRFAAGELSNGVWGFYKPVEKPK